MPCVRSSRVYGLSCSIPVVYLKRARDTMINMDKEGNDGKYANLDRPDRLMMTFHVRFDSCRTPRTKIPTSYLPLPKQKCEENDSGQLAYEKINLSTGEQ